MRLRLHHVLIFAGLAAGLVVGVLVLETDPRPFGWLLGAGAGLAGGAFIAAIVSGEPLASGGGDGTRTRRRRVNPALRHWEPSGPPSTNGKHEYSASEASDRPQERPDSGPPTQ